MRHAETVTFGGGGLDRDALGRRDPDILSRRLESPNARILPIWRGKPQLRVRTDGWDLAPVRWGAPILDHRVDSPVYLGRVGEEDWFGADISPWAPKTPDLPEPGKFFDATEQVFPGHPEDQRFVELRGAMTRLTPLDAEIAATGKAILAWHASHLFCARCGSPTEMGEAGWQRICPACNARHFPRTDPVVIMLITHGNSVLIGRSPQWPERMYSLLAGFVEPGETLEAAVRREVFEEAGVTVGPVGYLASQPWPFPASLMMGCWGEATSTDINLDPEEIEDARWMTREEMMDVFAGDHPEVAAARRGAIAHFLLEAWIADRLT